MRLMTQDRLLREAVREMLREGSERTMGMSARSAQDLRDYEKKEAEFRAASIPSGIGKDGFIGKSVYLRHVTDEDREALIVSRNSPTDDTATEYLIYLFDYSDIDINKEGMLSPPTMKNVSASEIQTILQSGAWKTSDRAVDYMSEHAKKRDEKLNPARFKLISVSDPSMKPWRLFGPIVEHTMADKFYTAGGFTMDMLGVVSEFADDLQAVPNPYVAGTAAALRALNPAFTAGSLAAAFRNCVNSWVNWERVSSAQMMDPVNQRKKMDAAQASFFLDVFGLCLSVVAWLIDNAAKKSAVPGAVRGAAESIPIILKWTSYAASAGMTLPEVKGQISDIFSKYPVLKNTFGSALDAAKAHDSRIGPGAEKFKDEFLK